MTDNLPPETRAVTVRMPEALHAEVRKYADECELSMNRICVEAIALYLRPEELQHRMELYGCAGPTRDPRGDGADAGGAARGYSHRLARHRA